jgi:hypothetical protein
MVLAGFILVVSTTLCFFYLLVAVQKILRRAFHHR